MHGEACDAGGSRQPAHPRSAGPSYARLLVARYPHKDDRPSMIVAPEQGGTPNRTWAGGLLDRPLGPPDGGGADLPGEAQSGGPASRPSIDHAQKVDATFGQIDSPSTHTLSSGASSCFVSTRRLEELRCRYSNSSSAGAPISSFRQRSSGTWAGVVDLRKSSRTARNRSASRHGRKCPAPSRISSRAPGMASAAR